MDKIPIHKLRRKPKPPAVVTSIGPNATGNNTQLDDAAVPRASDSPSFSSRMSPFRRLRGGKRARSCSPAASLLGEQPVAAIVSNSAKSSDEPSEEPSLKIPAFLTQSDAELQNRFQDIQDKEAERARSATNPDDDATKWSFYQREDEQGKNGMDRYFNIRPWSHNRVKLNVPEGALDYVNASPIAVPASDEEVPTFHYIAMQGPTIPAIDSVWRMVAENTTSTAVVVQLTTMMEGPHVKCSQYFPFSDEDKMWTLNAGDAWGDGWTATLSYESTEPLYDGAVERRKLLLRVGGGGGEEEEEEEENAAPPRTVTVWHLLYLRWPDFGTPALTDVPSFFALMRLSRELATEVAEPRFVHCSAGVGRTGTFICLEHLMRELETGALDALDADDAEADPIFETVDALRRQRRCMVQSAQQYAFLYQVMRQLWSERYGLSDDDIGGGGVGQQPAPKRLEMATEPVPDDDEEEEEDDDDDDDDDAASVGSQVSEGGVSLAQTQD